MHGILYLSSLVPRPSPDLSCNIEKLGVAWVRGISVLHVVACVVYVHENCEAFPSGIDFIMTMYRLEESLDRF